MRTWIATGLIAGVLLSSIACRVTGSSNEEAANLASASDAIEGGTVLVCAVGDGRAPRYEVEIIATGFDPQRGTTVAVYVHRGDAAGGKGELAASGHGQLDESALDVVFEEGRLVAQAEGKAYVGDLEMAGDEEARNVRCQ